MSRTRSVGNRFLPAALSLFGITAYAKADVITFVVPDLVVTPTAQTVSFPATPAGTAYGFNLNANWSANTGAPNANQLRIGTTPPGGTALGATTSLTGTSSTAPFVFPGPSLATTVNNGRYLVRNGVASAGQWDFAFSTTGAGTAANVQNSTISLYVDTAAVPGAFYNGDTTGAPVWNRPNQDGATLSTSGTATPFSSQVFNVPVAGRYMMGTSLDTAGFDGFMALYQDNFDSGTPLVNIIGADDDGFLGLSAGSSEFTAVLVPGVNYFLVTTGFNNTDFGLFHNFILGPGTPSLTPIPEPTSIALMGVGGALAVFVRNRRKK